MRIDSRRKRFTDISCFMPLYIIVTEPIVTFLRCHGEIRLFGSLAAALITMTRKEFERQRLQKDNEIAWHERGMCQRESEITEVPARTGKSDLHAGGSSTHCRTQLRQLRDGGRVKKSEAGC
jgi:hypothetical protein